MQRHNSALWGIGTTQNNRLLDALRPDYVKVDDRSLEDLLAFATEYSKNIQFYDHKNEANGHWDSFFLNDISAVLAVMLHTNLDELENQFNTLSNQILRAHEYNKKLQLLENLFKHLQKMAINFDDWYRQISRIALEKQGVQHEVQAELHHVISRNLILPLHRLRFYDEGASKGIGHKVGLNYDSFHSIWRLEEKNLLSVRERNIWEEGKNKAHQINLAILKMRTLHRNFHDALSYVVFNFRRYFEKSIQSYDKHQPDIGLFIAFLQTYKYQQDGINTIARRFLDFYYQRILQQKPRPNIPDTVNVCFDIADHLPTYTLHKGSLLDAGIDGKGNPILYETNNVLELNHIQIDSLKTLYLSQGHRETLTNYQLLTHVYAAEIANSKNGAGEPFDKKYDSWATFGEEQYEKLEGYSTMDDAEIGWAIASPAFYLREGKRQIQITLNFDPSTTAIYEKLVANVQRESAANGQPMEAIDAFYKVFSIKNDLRNVTILATGIRGWIPIMPEKIKFYSQDEYTFSPNTLRFYFYLDVTEPAIVPYDPQNYPNQKSYATSMPMVKILLNSDREPYLYSFLKEVRVASIDIEVEADKLKKFQFYNSLGQIDNSQPFNPLGPIPIVGSYLLLGNTELYRKQLTQLRFDMEWQEMPRTLEDFQTYFKDYQLESTDFKVKLTSLQANEFVPTEKEEALEFSLFNYQEGQDIFTSFELDAEKLKTLKFEPVPDLPTLNDYTTDTPSGYFRMELISPEAAFGHHLYQKVITKTMANNAKIISDAVKDGEEIDEDAIEMPNPPLSPVVKSIVASYKATSHLKMDDKLNEYAQQFFHVHPFGSERVYPIQSALVSPTRHLLPQYSADGYLFIGLKNVKPKQTLNLLFQMTPRQVKDLNTYSMPDIAWEYLGRNNEWKKLKVADLLSDGTDQFTTSGIIRIKIPDDISVRNTIMPAGTYWLRIAVTGDVEVLCHTIDLRTQAVNATWVNNDDPDFLRTPLAPNTIRDLYDGNDSIAAIYQPFESSGGRAAENDDEFFARVSERLRHKNRAITHWDFERMVIDKFPEIFQSKCLSYLSHPQIEEEVVERKYLVKKEEETTVEVKVVGIKRGEGIVLVVVPQRTRFMENETPVVNYRKLQAIETYLREYASPFVKIRVRNPDYEYIRVFCKVKFKEKGNDGQFVEQFREDIRRYISPWLYDNGAAMDIGGNINVDAMKNHLKKLPYVWFLTKFSMLHIIEESIEEQRYRLEDTATMTDDPNPTVYTSKPWSVLITDPLHEIEVINDDDEEEDLPEPVKPPVRFKNEYNILIRTQRIRILNPKPDIKIRQRKLAENVEYHLNITGLD